MTEIDNPTTEFPDALEGEIGSNGMNEHCHER